MALRQQQHSAAFSNKPRLLLMTADSGPGGTMRWLRNIYPYLCEHFDVTVALREPLGDEPAIDMAAPNVHLLPFLSARSLFAAGGVLRLLREHRPEVILASGFTSILCLLPIRWLRLHPRVPVLMVQRGVLREFAHVSQWKARLALWASSFATDARDHIAAVAPNAKNYLESSRYRTRPIEVIPNGIPTKELTPNKTGKPSGSTIHLGIIGRLSIEKGSDRIPAIANALSERDAVLHIVGAGDDESTLRIELTEAINAGKVVFHGWVDDPTKLLATMDLLLLPSRTEACPHVVLEAFALDIPVWAMAVGGLPYILDNGRAGRLYGELEDLLAELRSLSEQTLAEMKPQRTHGQRLLQQRYSEQTMVSTYLNRLDELRTAAA